MDPIAERALALVDADREEAIQELIQLAGGRRAPLDSARDALVARLSRTSEDFEATRALRLVTIALQRVGWEPTSTAHRT